MARRPGDGLGRYVGWSVLLAIGPGMLPGSIQHFTDFPHYAAALIPLGDLAPLAAYKGRERLSPPRPTLARLGATIAGVVVVLALGLDLLADGMVRGTTRQEAAVALDPVQARSALPGRRAGP